MPAMSLAVFLASLPHSRMRSLLLECSMGTGLVIPDGLDKRRMADEVERWLRAADSPASRKRDDAARRARARARAGVRLKQVLAQHGVVLP